MLDKTKKLPPRRYYSLADAVEQLNEEGLKCTLGDLFHFGATAAFEPIVYINNQWRFTGEIDPFQRGIYEIIETGDPDERPLTMYLYKYNGMDDYLYESDLCYLHIGSDLDDGCEHTPECSETVTIEGFVGFRPLNDHSFFRKMETDGCVPYEYVMFSPPFTGIIETKINNIDEPFAKNSQPPEPAFALSGGLLLADDLFISSYEMEILKRGGRREVGEDVFREFSSVRARKDDGTSQQNEGDPRYKWPQLIKDLIYLYYGDKEMAESPWKNIAELEKDFQSKGLELPSAKTLRRWLKDR